MPVPRAATVWIDSRVWFHSRADCAHRRHLAQVLRYRGLTRHLAGGRLYLALAGGALVIGALSLLIPSTPSYDPWAWLVWGREIVHLNLHTTGGPTWKPLPVIFTTLFAPFGAAAPDLWLVVARAGAVMAAAMVFKLAWRVASASAAWCPGRPRTAPRVVAAARTGAAGRA